MEGRDIVREANYQGADSYTQNPGYVNGIGMESHTPAVLGADKASCEDDSSQTVLGLSGCGPNRAKLIILVEVSPGYPALAKLG